MALLRHTLISRSSQWISAWWQSVKKDNIKFEHPKISNYKTTKSTQNQKKRVKIKARQFSCIIYSCCNACWKSWLFLVPNLHCSIKRMIVTIVEINMLILDGCVCLVDQKVQNVLSITSLKSLIFSGCQIPYKPQSVKSQSLKN